jgi:AbrB family looped-hinge helix DNA binding protein
MSKVKITTRGRITLPRDVRDRLALTPGTILDVSIDGAAVVTVRRTSRFPPVTVQQAHGSLVYEGPVRDIDDLDAGIAEMLRARAKRHPR